MTNNATEHPGFPTIYIVSCEQDKRVKDAIMGRLWEGFASKAPEVRLDIRDYELDRWDTSLTARFKEWSTEAWYVLFVVSNHWEHLRRNFLTELFVLENRADEIRARLGADNQFISMLCLEEPNDKVQTLVAKYRATCLLYTTAELANSSIDFLIDRFRLKPVWVTESEAARCLHRRPH